MMGVAGLAVSWATGAIAQQENASLIGADDLLNVLVLDWDPILGEVKRWEEVSGEYRVASDGTIVVPFVGRVVGQGRSTDEIASDIVAALREGLALSAPPSVTVEFAARPPVIVTGDVRSPGPYEITSGMLAMEAVGLAGGTGSAASDQVGYLRDLTSLRTNLQILQDQQLRLQARKARLQAELAGKTTLEFEQVPDEPEWAAIVSLEEQLMRVRADRLARELASIDGQSELFAAEIQALDQKTASLNRQRELASEAAANADSLVDRGLVAGQRLLETQNALASIDTQLLDVSTAILAARQNLASADRERVSLQDNRRAEILESLQDVEARLQDIGEQIAGLQTTLRTVQAGRPVDVVVEPIVTILRRAGATLERIEDAAMLPLRPGDMVEVRQPIRFGPELRVALPDDIEDVDDTAQSLNLSQAGGQEPAPLLSPSEPSLAQADAGDQRVESSQAPAREPIAAQPTSQALPEDDQVGSQPPGTGSSDASRTDAVTNLESDIGIQLTSPPLRPVSRPESFN
jgi:exopolysaccharide production protein ExoF